MRNSGKIVKPATETLRAVQSGQWMTPANVLVVYRVGDTVGQVAADYYRSVRGIPTANVVGVSLAWMPTTDTMSTSDGNALVAALLPFYKAPIQCIVTMHWWPQKVGTRELSNVLGNLILYSTYETSTRFDFYAETEERKQAGNFVGIYSSDFRPTKLAGAYLADAVYSGSLPLNNYFQVPPQDYLNRYSMPMIPHFRLEVPPVAVGDTRIANASELNYLKRIIDMCVSAETAKYSDFGTVLLNGSGSGCTTGDLSNCLTMSYPAYRDLQGVPCTKYYDNLTVEVAQINRLYDYAAGYTNTVGCMWRTVTGNHLMKAVVLGTTAAGEPVWDTAKLGNTTVDGGCTFSYHSTLPVNSYPGGAAALSPGKAGTFVNQTNVFFRSVGLDAYYGVAKEVETATHFSYRSGAIVLFGQSYSAIPHPVAALDYEFGTPVCRTQADTNCWNTQAPIQYQNANGFNNNAFYFKNTTAVSSATVGVPTAGQIVLKADTVTVATINVTSNSLRAQLVQIKAALPGGWTCEVNDAFCISRSDVAIRNGAAASFGSGAEPYTYGGIKASHITVNLWYGLSLGECAFTQNDVCDQQLTSYIIGDPLYRPFGHRRT